MTRARRKARRLRAWILAVGIVYTSGILAWLVLPSFSESLFDGAFEPAGLTGTPLSPGRLVLPAPFAYAMNVLIVLGGIVLAQWAFLGPGRGWTVRVTTIGRPLKSAVVAAAFMAMLLTIGLIAMILELPDWWSFIMGGTDDDPTLGGWGIVGVWAAMLLLWGFWAWIFFVYWRQGDRYTQMGRVIRALVAGSLLEAFVAVPLHIWATRQRECYCCRGTYTTLVFAGIVLLWAFGPGIILLYKREAYRYEKLVRGSVVACPSCGYDLRGSLAADILRCSECGSDVPTDIGLESR